MPLSARSREDQSDADLLSVQNPEYALVSNKQEGPVRCWLTYCSKPRACSNQQQAGRASQMVTYLLFKTQSMLLSGTSRKGQPDGDLHPVQSPEHAPVSNKQEVTARWWLTSCSKARTCSCQQQAGRASQMVTYILFKAQTTLVRNKQEGPARFWLTSCSKPRACSCQQQAGSNSQILTYILFKAQSMLLSATSRKSQPDPDLHPVQKPEHAPVSNKQEELAKWRLTSCSKPRAQSCQQQAGRASQILTYKLFKSKSKLLSVSRGKGQPHPDLHAVQNPEKALVSIKQEGPAISWLTCCSKPRACSCQYQAGRASQILTY